MIPHAQVSVSFAHLRRRGVTTDAEDSKRILTFLVRVSQCARVPLEIRPQRLVLGLLPSSNEPLKLVRIKIRRPEYDYDGKRRRERDEPDGERPRSAWPKVIRACLLRRGHALEQS